MNEKILADLPFFNVFDNKLTIVEPFGYRGISKLIDVISLAAHLKSLDNLEYRNMVIIWGKTWAENLKIHRSVKTQIRIISIYLIGL